MDADREGPAPGRVASGIYREKRTATYEDFHSSYSPLSWIPAWYTWTDPGREREASPGILSPAVSEQPRPQHTLSFLPAFDRFSETYEGHSQFGLLVN